MVSADPTQNDNSIEAASETTPLLGAPESGDLSKAKHGSPIVASDEDAGPGDADDGKPMPLKQILLLCYCAVSEPIAYFAIFPFINEMIELKGQIPEENVGFWSGMIESLFSLVQVLLMIFYGRAADRLGRKPVLVFSLTGVGLATTLFGMSQNLWQMILTRCLAGVFAGSVVTVRTMISENCTKETQGRAFSWYMFVRNTGILLGPLIGGGLANPAQQFPRVFGGVAFWEKYPYALSTFAVGVIVLSAALSSLLFLEETLNKKSDGQSKSEPPMSTWELLNSPGVAMVLYISGHIAMLALCYTAVMPVMMYTSVGKGGFGFSDQQIALFIALAGGSQALWTLIAFPLLQRRFSTGAVLRGSAIAWPFFMAGYPIANEFLRHGWKLTFWIGTPIAIAMGSAVSMSFAGIQLCINDISPTPAVLGTLNAVSLSIGSGIRAFAPVLATSIFATGIKSRFADGHLVWFFLGALAAGLIPACYYLPEGAEGRVKKASSPERRQDNSESR